jgi:hypothetical protein
VKLALFPFSNTYPLTADDEKINFKNYLEISTFIKFQYIAVRKGKTQSESEVTMNNMSEMDEVIKDELPDEELIDTLIAISVVSKRLAHKLRIIKEKGGNENNGEK